MEQFSGNLLIIAGVILVVLGLAFSGKLSPLGRLPGDISIGGGNFTFYIPITTMIIISAVLTLLFWIFGK